MKKPLIILCAVFTLFSKGHGNFFCDCNLDPYIGIVGGLAILSGEHLSTNNTTGLIHNTRFGGIAGLVGGVIGIQTHICHNIFLALQGNALYNCLSKNEKQDVVPGDGDVIFLKNRFQGGVDARFGYRFCDTTFYILGGFEAGKWRRIILADTQRFSQEVNKCLCGPKIGSGLTFPLFCSIWLNFEYSYTWFGNMKKNYIDTVTLHSWNTNEKIREHSILWGINYLF